MDGAAGFVAAVETPLHDGSAGGDVVAVIGETFAGREHGSFVYDALALDDLAGAVVALDDPFAAKELDGVLGGVVDGDEINKRVRLVGGQAFAAMVVNEFIEAGGESGEFVRSGHGNIF